jgi:hypothetical protein
MTQTMTYGQAAQNAIGGILADDLNDIAGGPNTDSDATDIYNALSNGNTDISNTVQTKIFDMFDGYSVDDLHNGWSIPKDSAAVLLTNPAPSTIR